jgi:hypothetical protein
LRTAACAWIPGSHEKLLPHGKSARTGNILGNNQEIDPEFIDESAPVDLELKAGQAVAASRLDRSRLEPEPIANAAAAAMTVRFTAAGRETRRRRVRR